MVIANKMKKKPGMTLVEVLIGLAVGSIVIGASFFVITQFSKQYQIASDYIEISQNARYSLFLMKRDIRMAGYKDPESEYSNISNPISIESSDNDCCDKITIIYDKDKLTRFKVLYEVLDNRLLQSKFKCEVGGTCTGPSGSWQVLDLQQPISQNISNLKFIKNVGAGDSLYFWSSDRGIDMFKIPINTGIVENLWKLECCESGKGKSMTSNGVNIFYFWIDEKIYEININTGEKIAEWSVEPEGKAGSNIIYGDEHLYLWADNWIYKYNIKSQSIVLKWEGQFSFQHHNGSAPYFMTASSGEGSGREIAYGNNEIYLWHNYYRITVFDTETGAFKRNLNTDINFSKRIASYTTAGGRSCMRSASMTYKDNNLYLIGRFGDYQTLYIVKLNATSNAYLSNFKGRVIGDYGRAYEMSNTCGDSSAIGKDHFYIWSNDEVYPLKMPFPEVSSYDISNEVFKTKVMVECSSEYNDAGNCGGGENKDRSLSFRSNQDGVGSSGGWGTNMVYVPAQINGANTNIEMQISLEKNYINKKIEETFYSSATVRNF